MRKFLAFFLAAVVFVGLPSFTPQAYGMGSRVYNSAYRPYRLLAKQYAAGANVFPTADPSPAGTPLTLSNAMGTASNDGVVTLCLDAGFTAPITLTCYYWQQDAVTPSNACWIRAAGSAALYAFAVDTNYASVSFSIPPNAPFIVSADKADTGKVYCSAPADPNNPTSTAPGY